MQNCIENKIFKNHRILKTPMHTIIKSNIFRKIKIFLKQFGFDNKFIFLIESTFFSSDAFNLSHPKSEGSHKVMEQCFGIWTLGILKSHEVEQFGVSFRPCSRCGFVVSAV